jgi:hypothetical protein
MKIKFIILVAIVFLGTMILAYRASSVSNKQPSDTIYSREWASLSEHAQKAKAQGKKKVVFPASIGIPAHVEGLSDALRNFSALVVQPVAQKSYAQGEMDIITWHKFKVLDDLSPDKSEQASHLSSIDSLPKEIDETLLPIQQDEILVPQSGGILSIDGVTLIQETDRFPFLSMNRKYLIFVTDDHSNKVRLLEIGPYGVFKITSDGRLDPLVDTPSSLSRDIKQYHNSSLTSLKTNLGRRPSQQ